jgi:hypothetical protein
MHRVSCTRLQKDAYAPPSPRAHLTPPRKRKLLQVYCAAVADTCPPPSMHAPPPPQNPPPDLVLCGVFMLICFTVSRGINIG